MFNARSEGVHTSPVFKRLLRARRCAVPMDGFWEWKEDELVKKDGKQPWYVQRASGEPLWMAGLHDTRASDHLETFTVLTMDVDPKLRWLHDRQPVILTREGLAQWLAAPSSAAAEDDDGGGAMERGAAITAGALRTTLPCAELKWHPTTKKISKMDYQGADAASPVKLPSQQQRSVASFFQKRPGPTPSTPPTTADSKSSGGGGGGSSSSAGGADTSAEREAKRPKVEPKAEVVVEPDADEQAVERLVALGFARAQAAQAYLECGRNEMLAANVLMDSA